MSEHNKSAHQGMEIVHFMCRAATESNDRGNNIYMQSAQKRSMKRYVTIILIVHSPTTKDIL